MFLRNDQSCVFVFFYKLQSSMRKLVVSIGAQDWTSSIRISVEQYEGATAGLAGCLARAGPGMVKTLPRVRFLPMGRSLTPGDGNETASALGSSNSSNIALDLWCDLSRLFMVSAYPHDARME
jgi:hypothetical protein